ncbi:MAG: DNA cytosine methyltransferase [Sphingomonadaceae bacterium]|nr:DNA cytosine methyltransferase [Sphingomonadaceae bacterium]
MLTSIELCAGAGGQALGLEQAGFQHRALVELEPAYCRTLQLNRPNWNVIASDLNEFDARPYSGVDLVAAGLPCPPFSKAGKQLGAGDERNLFPAALRIIEEVQPGAVLIENVRGFLDAVFEDYRVHLRGQLARLGYWSEWKLLNAADFGVPQLRPRVAIVALRRGLHEGFRWPEAYTRAPSVGEALEDLMAANGWRGARFWANRASDIAPTLVGGSLKHGGPDLGPTRARQAWAALGVEGRTLANEPPEPNFTGMPRLTVRMAARIQGFPDDWAFAGGKTVSYRQVGNAFPPPVARALGVAIRDALNRAYGWENKIGCAG